MVITLFVVEMLFVVVITMFSMEILFLQEYALRVIEETHNQWKTLISASKESSIAR